MTDARSKQPAKRMLDLRDMRSGDQFVAIIETWPYSSIKSEDVFARELTVHFAASDFADATGFARSLATVIKTAHDVWECNVRLVAEERFHTEGKTK